MPTVSFLIGVVVLGYLFTFVLFAILRVVTGVSIQRVGYTGFRRIAFSPRNGIKINIRGVGLSVHRPTFALPTWCSLVITELQVTIDLKALSEGKDRHYHAADKSNGSVVPNGSASKGSSDAAVHGSEDSEDGHGRTWRKLTDVKEKIKRLHTKIEWIKLVDLVVVGTSVNVLEVGRIQIERAMLIVDTRSKTVDRSRLFQHTKAKPDSQSPAEWKSVVRSVLFTPHERESTEILDYCTLSIHGLLHKELEGLRDASIALKLGRLNIPYDDLDFASQRATHRRQRASSRAAQGGKKDMSFTDALEEMNKPGSREESIVQTVSDSKEFISSILRGIQEVQLAIGFFGLSKKLLVASKPDQDVYFNMAMKEVGIDVLRLDSRSPAHRMYFSRNDVAHQALLTAISISAGIDDGHMHPERMLYVPMITATIKTTLPSKTIQYTADANARERNSNILFANLVCTSPSVDLDPKHLPLLLDIVKNQSSSTKKPDHASRHHLISRLLPKASIKFSIQEPVIRVSLPPMNKSTAEEGDYDILISSVSSMSLDLESSHALDGNLHYALASHYRHTNHQLYYQTASADRHDLLQSDTVELKLEVNALPEILVVGSGKFSTLNLFFVRPDICEGVRQIVHQLRKNAFAKESTHQQSKISFLRRMPEWLQRLQVEGSDFNVEIAGVDKQISKESRGFALHLDSWNTEYKAHRDEAPDLLARRGSITKVVQIDKHLRTPPRSPRSRPQSTADGRRLAVHLQGFEGLVIDSIEDSQPESFMSLPRFEIAFSTSTDHQGPLFHINSHAKSLLLHYSLYNHFAIGVGVMVIKQTFLERQDDKVNTSMKNNGLPKHASLKIESQAESEPDGLASREITTVDFKANLVQLKATMPADPPLMLQIFGLDAGHHRWATPFFRSRLTRLYAKAPSTRSVWSRLVSLKTLRLDLREIKRKYGKQYVAERSIEVSTETIRIGVPHQLVVHSIFDNIANVVKTTQQLHHHFSTGTLEYILVKEPEGPKNVPRINVRTQVLIFEIEDSSFEWKLGAIYRAGLLEQKQRLAREEVFKMKVKTLEKDGQQRGSSRLRARSAHHSPRERSESRAGNVGKRRSKSSQPMVPDSPSSSHRHGRRKIRYDADGKCGISGKAQTSIDRAKEKLMHLNAQTWKSRIDRVLSFQTHAIRDLRAMFWGLDEVPEELEQHEPILALSQRPGLLTVCMTDLNLTVDKPSFPVQEYPKFLHEVGKGMPHDMKYGLLVPMSLQITLGEARFHLRDYPLPLLHVPPLAPGQSPRLPSLSLKTDFVVAEEFRDVESQRHVKITVVPPEKLGSGESPDGFTVDVRRTISPVKTYSDMKIEVNTSHATRITWGSSYQPAIQDMMQVIEGFTKPPVDPSDRVGFWDKIRCSFHSRVNVAWKGDGDVHVVLKGSRDPYVVTGTGAGFVFVWRNDVRWNIAQHKDPRQFMTVDSGDYILAVPDFNHYARHAPENDQSDDSGSTSTNSAKRGAMFKKVVMKLSGNVRWLAGLVFEREVSGGGRSFDFKPHYDIVLKHPDFAKAAPGEVYDGYRNFRSHHIHMSIAIAAPHDRDWSVSNLKPSSNYNSVHLSPRAFAHFFSWWSMFSGIMSLPVRQGPLWGAMEKSSKKFGRHLATIKYNLLLSPLFISHIYKHKDAEEYQKDTVSATGLKLKLDSFMLDLHQRRETFEIQGHAGAQPKKSSGMKINQSQLDFISADMRAVSASIGGTNADDIEHATEDTLASFQEQMPSVDMSKFTIPDNDFTWIDMDDFVELDWILPAESNPETKILPLGYAPRFTYFRQTDHGDSVSGDTTRSSPYGDEATHYCVMSAKNDPRRVQAELIEDRLKKLREQKAQNQRAMGEQELKVVQNISGDKAVQSRLDILRNHSDTLQRKYEFLELMLERLTQRLEHDDPEAIPDLETNEEFHEAHEHAKLQNLDLSNVESTHLADYTSDFNNRFVVHNAQIKWNNSLRNIILRYIHQVSQRRGFVYYMSRRAVKFILDILDEQKKPDGSSTPTPEKAYSAMQDPTSPGEEDEATVQDRIDQLLRDGRSFVAVDDKDDESAEDSKSLGDTAGEDIAVEFTAQSTYHFRLIAPQIQLQSEKNPKSAVLVTAKGMQLKVVQIMDRDRVTDDVSGLVQRRFTAAMDSLQMYVTSTKTFSTEFIHMYSGNRYGVKAGTYWPPWVPLEVMFEYQVHPYGFNRVVQRTSASLRYDKYNTLRLKYNDDVTGGEQGQSANQDESENRMDHVWLEFPHFRAICDSAQYYAMYIIVMDLLLYNEPLEKTRSERLEKIMLASDFSDLTGAPEMVQMLQERIRQLEEIKMHFQINEKFLDRQGWKDRIALDQDLAGCEDELFFMMKAITTSQRRIEDRHQQDHATGMLHLSMSAKEIAWHLIKDKGESLLEFQLKHASYDRTDNTDGSNYNSMEIGRINGFNLLPDAIYPEIVAPYVDAARGLAEQRDQKMLRVHWLMLEAIAGIPVVDHFEVDLVPLKIQLEREIAKKLFEYIFPGVGGNAFDGGGFSPFMVKNMLPTQEEEDEDQQGSGTPGTASEVTSLDTELPQANTTGAEAGALELRLKPTMNLPEHRKPKHNKGLGISNGPHWSIFHHSDRSHTTLSKRPNIGSNSPSATNLSVMTRSPSERSLATLATKSDNTTESERSKRFPLHRSTSGDKRSDKKKGKDDRSDDLTQMMNRASNYMTLAFVKIPSVVLCLSYKGKGQRNLEDVHDLVFRMPTLEYRNKTWSNLDLALAMKKDVIKALISHAGAIVGNKFSHHRPNKQQSSRLREIANMSTLMSVNSDGSMMPSTEDSGSPRDQGSEQLRQSFTSGRTSTLARSVSYTSSTKSSARPSGQATPETERSERPQSQPQSQVHRQIQGSPQPPDPEVCRDSLQASDLR